MMVRITAKDEFLMREYGVYPGMNFKVVKKEKYHPHPRKNPDVVIYYYWITTVVTGDNNHKGQWRDIRITGSECEEIQGPEVLIDWEKVKYGRIKNP